MHCNIVFTNLDKIDIESAKAKWNEAIARNIVGKINKLPQILRSSVFKTILEEFEAQKREPPLL